MATLVAAAAATAVAVGAEAIPDPGTRVAAVAGARAEIPAAVALVGVTMTTLEATTNKASVLVRKEPAVDSTIHAIHRTEVDPAKAMVSSLVSLSFILHLQSVDNT